MVSATNFESRCRGLLQNFDQSIISNSPLSRAIQPSFFRSSEAIERISVVGNLRATTGKEDVQDNLLFRSPRVFAFAFIFKFFASAIEPSLDVFEVEHQPTWS